MENKKVYYRSEKTGSRYWDMQLDRFNLSDEALAVIKQLRINERQGILAELHRFIETENRLNTRKIQQGLEARLREKKNSE